jgi:hypothetical protein
MKTLITCALVALFVALHVAHADSWLCREESSVRIGGAYGTINACGIGEAPSEQQARLAAFDSAKAEFTRVCRNSVDCHDHNVTVTPARTECEVTNGGFRCYRLVRFHIEQTHNQQIAQYEIPIYSQIYVPNQKQGKVIDQIKAMGDEAYANMQNW